MLGVALARATDAPGRGYHWGPEAHHSKLPRGRRVKVDQVDDPRVGALRPGAGRRRHREPHRGAAQVDGHDRVLRPQGVPARRGRRRARTARDDDRRPSSRRWAGAPSLSRCSRRRCARSCCGRGGSRCWRSASSSRACSRGSGSGSSGRAIDTDPTPPGATEEVQPLADVAAPGEYLPEPLVGQRVTVDGHRGSPEDFLVVESRLNDGVEGYWVTGQLRRRPSDRRGDQPVSRRGRDRVGCDRRRRRRPRSIS